MQRDRTELLLREPNLYKAFIILALPVFGANFMKAFNDLVDTYFIGQLENSVAAQAGVSIAWPLINILISFQVGMSVAGVSIISQLLGMGKKEDARENAGTLLILSMAFGLVLNVLLYLLASPVMRLMGAEGDVLECSVVYCQVRSFELLFAFIFSAFQSIRQAQGDTVTPVVLSVGSVLINIVLTAVLVRGCGLGVFGAGLATAIGQAAAVFGAEASAGTAGHPPAARGGVHPRRPQPGPQFPGLPGALHHYPELWRRGYSRLQHRK